jgi:hypothetical protein
MLVDNADPFLLSLLVKLPEAIMVLPLQSVHFLALPILALNLFHPFPQMFLFHKEAILNLSTCLALYLHAGSSEEYCDIYE